MRIKPLIKFYSIDNTGVDFVKTIHIYDMNILKPCGIILISTRKVVPNKRIKKGQIYKAVIVRLCKQIIRPVGLVVNFYKNCIVILKKTENVPIGTRIYGSVYVEARLKGFIRIVSLSAFLF